MAYRMRAFLIAAGMATAAILLLLFGPARAQGDSLFLPLVSGGSSTTPISLGLETIVAPGGLQQPVGIANAGDERLFVLERAGRIQVIAGDGTVGGQPFLDIRDRVESQGGGEQGLLGLAFHPDYSNNGHFYVNYTAKPEGDTHIARFSVTHDPNLADADSEVILLTVAQPYPNHNGGDLAFGPHDGYLYVALGDGGSGNDPGNRAQDTGELLGKLLRLDVDGGPGSRPADCGTGDNYRIPSDNPLIGEAGACDEIWALGLRNPWRLSFDAPSDDLFIADVGQVAWEEVNVRPATAAGENYGWSCYEGTHENPNTAMQDCGPASAYTMPVFEYGHDEGCAITGGYVYRGSRNPALHGRYLFTDFCSGYFWNMSRDSNGGWSAQRHDELAGGRYASLGEDSNGELYVADMFAKALYRITEASGSEAP
ncbi:MAG: PQQ-dependent sugar dehydrogenase [Anaerolineae bacterium]|nr:PQQ-dependent sugar dehydrogenase [Anaerolineae bacterium]